MRAGCRVVHSDGNLTPREDGLTFPYVLFDPDDVDVTEIRTGQL